mgnify:CR=1 FL=1
MIVPTLLEYDYPDREDGETLFVLPFKPDKTEQCFREIKERLETLENPLLFLNNLKSGFFLFLITINSSTALRKITAIILLIPLKEKGPK